jgi:hypothetical protein
MGCAVFASCQKPTHIQLINNRVEEKIFNYGLGDYYSDTGRIRNVEHRYVEYGEMTEVLIRAYSVKSEMSDLVDEVFIHKIAANSSSDAIEIKDCDEVEIIYLIYAYNHYYLDNERIGSERIKFDKIMVHDKIKYGKINRITIKD